MPVSEREREALMAITIGHVGWGLDRLGCTCTPDVEFAPMNRKARRAGTKPPVVALHHHTDCARSTGTERFEPYRTEASVAARLGM